MKSVPENSTTRFSGSRLNKHEWSGCISPLAQEDTHRVTWSARVTSAGFSPRSKKRIRVSLIPAHSSDMIAEDLPNGRHLSTASLTQARSTVLKWRHLGGGSCHHALSGQQCLETVWTPAWYLLVTLTHTNLHRSEQSCSLHMSGAVIRHQTRTQSALKTASWSCCSSTNLPLWTSVFFTVISKVRLLFVSSRFVLHSKGWHS